MAALNQEGDRHVQPGGNSYDGQREEKKKLS